ncbi:TIR domain-containing protein [Phormidesmis priestleyi]
MPSTNPPLSNLRRNDLFISYSRRDKEFVHNLDAAFRKLNRDPWIDWEDIPDGEEWRKAIALGIENADTFIFVVTPDSAASRECIKELEQAIALNKRIIPIVRRETTSVHPVLAELNWIFFRESDDFNIAFRKLIKAINTDLPHVQTHTRLLSRAIEWEHGRDDGFLLRGKDLKSAEEWLAKLDKKEPRPTELQYKYILKSREVEAADRRLADVGRRAKRIVRMSAVLSLSSLVSATAAIVFAVHRFDHMISELKQQTQQLNTDIEARKSQIEGLNLQQRRLNQDKTVLIKQLKKFGFTDQGLEDLLASSPAEQDFRVGQIKKANDSYHQTIERLAAQTDSSASIVEPTPPPKTVSPAPTPSPVPSTPAPTQPVVQRPQPITVEYYPKNVDPDALEATLTKLGFNLEIKQPEVTDIPINILFYGKNVSDDDVKLVAYTLIRAGVQIKAILPFTRLADEKATVIQVGALPGLDNKPALKVEEIRSQPLPLPR